MWEPLLLFMVKFGYIALIVYGMLRSLLPLVINNIYGGKIAIYQNKQNN